MSYDERGGGTWVFPRTGWSTSAKELWRATQKENSVRYDVLDILYQLSKLISKEDLLMFLSKTPTNKFKTSRELPILKTGTVKVPNATENSGKETKLTAGKFLTIEENDDLADWAERKLFGESYERGGFFSRRGSGKMKINYPSGYKKKDLRRAVRFAFSKADVPKKSQSQKAGQPSLSSTDVQIIEALPKRFNAIDLESKSSNKANENRYFDPLSVLNSTLLRISKEVFDTFGANDQQHIYNIKKTKWRISIKDSELFSQRDLKNEEQMDIFLTKSFDLYTDGKRELKDWSAFTSKIKKQVTDTLQTGDQTFDGIPPFELLDVSLKIKKTQKKRGSIKSDQKMSYSQKRFFSRESFNIIKFDLILKFHFLNPNQYKPISLYFKENTKQKDYVDWHGLLRKRTFGTLVPSMVKPTKPKVEKMPTTMWRYYAEVADGRVDVNMRVGVKDRTVEIGFDGRSARNYAFESPGTAELLKILKKTKWTKGTGGSATYYGDGASGTFAEFRKK